eukprot:SM000993S25179  [mRNA]  locus=s993:149:1381:+ [translate_table: standard]
MADRLEAVLEQVALRPEDLSSTGRANVTELAKVAAILGLPDARTASFVAGMSGVALRAAANDGAMARLSAASDDLLARTRAALARLAALNRTMARLEEAANAQREAATAWRQLGSVMDAKDAQYQAQAAVYQEKVAAAGYRPGLSHRALLAAADERERLMAAIAPLRERLRNYQDVPPDKVLAQSMVEARRRELAAAEQRLEDLLAESLGRTEGAARSEPASTMRS